MAQFIRLGKLFLKFEQKFNLCRNAGVVHLLTMILNHSDLRNNFSGTDHVKISRPSSAIISEEKEARTRPSPLGISDPTGHCNPEFLLRGD